MEMTATTLTEITLYCINSSCKVKSINYYLEAIKNRELLRCYECADHLIDRRSWNRVI